MRGGQYQVLLLLDGLRQAGHDQTLLAREGSPLYKAARAAGHNVAHASLPEVWRSSGSVNMVHAHDARGHTLAALVAQSRFVVSRRVAFPVRSSAISRWKYRKAAGYLAVSHFVGKELEKAGIPQSRIQVVYDAVESYPSAEAWNPECPVVALQSGDPGKLSSLAAAAAELAKLPVVFSNNLPESLRRASAFLYLTESEGLGSAAILAMSMGVPVIASRVGGLAEVFVHGESGLYVPNDPMQIAGVLRSLFADPGLAHRLRAGGMARVAAQFTPGHMVTGTIRAYERFLA